MTTIWEMVKEAAGEIGREVAYSEIKKLCTF
ncbi:hypothetical protein TDB9533_00857 [Thalassocella blandensis]|nr:hypothetical protein TDB9533_00857 [Thalassocella blandensis]